jgi:hypothetical protein
MLLVGQYNTFSSAVFKLNIENGGGSFVDLCLQDYYTFLK